jgi:dinuclear metal center YbgI/SA1388 family protein
MNRAELINYLDDYLQVARFQDYGPQGLQVEAEHEEIQRIALAVDVAPAVIAAAAGWQADMLLVHHGILWRDVERIAGPLGQRVRRLLRHNINLYAAHLCLDAHQEVGNNAVLAERLQVTVTDWWYDYRGGPLAVLGLVAPGTTRDQFVQRVNRELLTEARLLPHGPELLHKVAILSGFGATEVGEAAALGADTFLTGETSHANYWAAADHGLNVIYAGHYASEQVGVQALGRHLSDKFGLECRFFDFPTQM